jgi:hypothetical protein
MALTDCPECGNKISEKAVFCPMCGYSVRTPGAFYCFEYVSKKKVFGLPLFHVVLGPAVDPATSKIRVAKGIVAIGGIAVGVLAIGGLALGVIAIGGLGLGLMALGGASIGVAIAVGGAAVGFVAIGGATFGYYAVGGTGWCVHALKAIAKLSGS